MQMWAGTSLEGETSFEVPHPITPGLNSVIRGIIFLWKNKSIRSEHAHIRFERAQSIIESKQNFCEQGEEI